MRKDSKISAVVNSIEAVLELLGRDGYELAQCVEGIANYFKATPLITYDEYLKYYHKYHKLVSRYYKDCYNDRDLYTKEMKLFEHLVKNSPEVPNDVRDEIIKKVQHIDTNKEVINSLINTYTGETQLCYGINMWLRGCQPEDYIYIKCFVGTLMYAMGDYTRVHPSEEIGRAHV